MLTWKRHSAAGEIEETEACVQAMGSETRGEDAKAEAVEVANRRWRW